MKYLYTLYRYICNRLAARKARTPEEQQDIVNHMSNW